MRMVLIAVIALLVLGGGGAGAYFYFQKQAQASVGGEAGASAKLDKKELKKIDTSKIEYVELDPLILPIIDANGVSQTVSLVLSLQVSDPAAKKEVETLIPRLKDAYIQDMYGMLNEHAALKGGVIQVSTIKKRLNKITVSVMGEDVVDDVLLQVVQQRPI